MSMSSHLSELRKKHQALSAEIEEEQRKPSSDDLAIKQLKDLDVNHKKIADICKKINKLESKADTVFDKAVADIFENETDVKNVIKYKEVLSALESASDKCKSVSNVLEQISVKHS